MQLNIRKLENEIQEQMLTILSWEDGPHFTEIKCLQLTTSLRKVYGNAARTSYKTLFTPPRCKSSTSNTTDYRASRGNSWSR